MEKYICAYCGAVIEDEEAMIMTCDGHTFCNEECANQAGYYRCADCGDWEPDCVEVSGVGMVCEYCREHGSYHQCKDCGDWFLNEDMTTLYGRTPMGLAVSCPLVNIS